jgi:hypothetical protein
MRCRARMRLPDIGADGSDRHLAVTQSRRWLVFFPVGRAGP